MPVRLKQDLKHCGTVFAAGTEVDLDALGLDQKSAIAEGWAEPANLVGEQPAESDLSARIRELEAENARLRGGGVQTMDRKAKGSADADAVKVETGSSRPPAEPK